MHVRTCSLLCFLELSGGTSPVDVTKCIGTSTSTLNIWIRIDMIYFSG